MAFVNLHVHTEGSLLDGMCRVKNLVPYIKSLGQNAIAISDHGTMYSYLKFYKLCKKEGLNPIIGLEVYIVPNMKEHVEIQTLAKADKTIKIKEEFNRRASELPSHFGNSSVVMDADGQITYKFGMGHLILLAKNNEGLNNLFQIATHAQLEGMYNRPRIDLEYIRSHADGLIALSACRAGTIPRLILRQEFDLAKEEIRKHQAIFPDFYLEIQPAECVEQRFVNAKLIELSAEMNVPLVCTADSHYLREEDALDHEVLLAVQTASTMTSPNRFKFDANIYYIYTEEQMRDAGMPEESIQNTQVIADMCQVDIELGKPLLPKIEVPRGYTLDTYLSKLCYNNLYKYYSKGLIEDIDQALDRMAFELDVMSKKGISGYELIVYDFIKFAKENGIPTGPGRGSGAGSIVNYVLGITDVNPLRYDLLFQRFISIDRPGFPDIDSDIAEYVNLSDFGIKSGREQVYEYLVNKYGKEYTSQIITFGKMKAKAALKDIGRALSVPYDEINSINKFIPADAGKQWTLEECLKGRDDSPAISEIVTFSEKYPDLFRVALKLEDMPRHTSVHAAGVVIAPQPVNELVPLSLASKESSSEKIIVTQLDMNELEEIGILKFDLLGLKTLGVIDRAIKLINKNHSLNLKSSDIDNDDASALALIKKGETLGVFQIESSGMTEMFTSMKRLRFVDIVAGISLYRPGPMDMIPSYIARLNGREEIEYMFPQMEPILKETFGIIVYQEQLMKIATDLAGFSKSDSDNYRKATGKKIIAKIKEMNQWLVYGHKDESKGIDIPGMVPQGYDEDKCLQLADQLVNFGKYSFGKRISVVY